MRLTVVRGGGLLGLVVTTTADSAALSSEDAEALRAKVRGSGLLELPERVWGGGGMPDAFDYKFVVEEEGRTKEVLASEAALPPGVRSLISWLDSLPGREERIAPPGT